jgi:hypothetical protein
MNSSTLGTSLVRIKTGDVVIRGLYGPIDSKVIKAVSERWAVMSLVPADTKW